MRLASNEVKDLLARGQRDTARVAGMAIFGRTLMRMPPPSQDMSRIALAVPKRLLKRAVDRNRVKRILREAFRQHAVRHAGLDTLVTLSGVTQPVGKTAWATWAKTMRTLADGLFGKLVATHARRDTGESA